MKPDPKAREIILKAYWSAKGWRTPAFSVKDHLYLQRTGYLFRGRTLPHDEAVRRAIDARSRVSKTLVVNAFVSSLGSRMLEYRSPLGSYASALHLREHPFERTPVLLSDLCRICGAAVSVTDDYSVLSFEQLKWGGLRHAQLAYEAFDLEQLCELRDPVTTEAEWQALATILRFASASPCSVTSLKKSMATVVKSNDAERDALCHILAYAGVLSTPGVPSFFDAYVPYDERHGGGRDSDQEFPLSRWRGGVSAEAIAFWFPPLANRAG